MSLPFIRLLSSVLVSSRKSIDIAIPRRYFSNESFKTSSTGNNKLTSKCSTDNNGITSSNLSAPVNDSVKEGENDEDDMEEMFVVGPGPNKDIEWGGPTRGGVRPEPTRYGDWERKGRASDFQ